MTKISVVAVVLAAMLVVADATSASEMRKKIREMTAGVRQQQANSAIRRPAPVFRTETSSTFVTMQFYSDDDCGTQDFYYIFGTNICFPQDAGSSGQYFYTASSSTSGTLSQQFYSDSACSVTDGPSQDVAIITATNTCLNGMKYAVSTTFNLPSSPDGYTTEHFATASQCTAKTPYLSYWTSTGSTPVDDALLYECQQETDDGDGSVTFYATTYCTGSCHYPTAAPTLSAGDLDDDDSANCFAGSETMTMESGEVKPISAIVRGDRVLAADAFGNTKFSTVVAVPHASNNVATVFTHITAASGADIKMTEDHLLMVSPSCGDSGSAELMTASSVEVGMCVMTGKGRMEKVDSVGTVSGNGVYTIVTEEEFIVVNGFVTSPFATNHAAGHAFYNIIRLLPASFLEISVVKRAIEIFGAMTVSV